jgi:hypothetical protein
MPRRSLLAALVLICAIASGLASTPTEAVQRVVMVENFTNYICPPCDAIRDSMNAILLDYIAQGKAAPLRYHVWWPGPNDPYYLFNTKDSQNKVNFYGVGYVPTLRFDGTIAMDPSDPEFATLEDYYNAVRAKIDSLYSVPSPIRIHLEQNRNATTAFVRFSIVAADTAGIGTTQYLRLVVAEEDRNFEGEKHRFIFRDYVPSDTTGGADTVGVALSLSLGDSLYYEWTYPIDAAYNPVKLVTYVYLQRANKKILQIVRAPFAALTDVETAIGPVRFRLEQNTPNPFNPITNIPYVIEAEGDVRLTVFDTAGRRVSELVNGRQSIGPHTVVWNGLDHAGRPVSSGVYYYRLEGVSASETRKMTLVR